VRNEVQRQWLKTKVLLKKHPMREHVLRLGHDWALARLKGKVLVAQPIPNVDGSNRPEV